jgi:DNA-binding NarL/FixJ family response regulator
MVDVVVCDDHGIIRSGISRILADTPGFILRAAVSTGSEFLAAAAEVQPRLAVLDIHLPDVNGLDLLDMMPKISPDTSVVMLSMYNARGYIEKAKLRGARGYITKECLEEELLDVLRKVLTGSAFVSNTGAVAATDPDRGESAQRIDLLSSRELEVLAFVAAGLTNGEVAARLCVSPRTVESHRASLQRKLLVRTRADLARLAREAGLIE